MLTAFCDRSGAIGFCTGSHPDITLRIASHTSDALLRGAIAVVARHAHDKNSLFVPGIPEASDSEAALDALGTFIDRIKQRLRDDLAQKTSANEQSLVPCDGDVAHRRGYKKHENPFTPGTPLHNN